MNFNRHGTEVLLKIGLWRPSQRIPWLLNWSWTVLETIKDKYVYKSTDWYQRRDLGVKVIAPEVSMRWVMGIPILKSNTYSIPNTDLDISESHYKPVNWLLQANTSNTEIHFHRFHPEFSAFKWNLTTETITKLENRHAVLARLKEDTQIPAT